ncbi:hypothetical protein ACEF39_001628 [Stenotrophomonas indicatrix]|uniref:Uncharacterized protein n=1 Tax=Knufia peltigerae TaxID=1002370 RepID=A0AA39CL56_9EURO|nr:hypothetical protein H2204_015081 [Knufia peltigerae]
MTSYSASSGRRAVAAILAVFAAALLPSLVIGGLIAGLSLGQEVATAALAAALMFVLAFAHAVAVLLPMGLILLSSGRLRRAWFALVGAGLGALAMATCAWPDGSDGALMSRLTDAGSFDWTSYAFSVLVAAGFGLMAGLAFHAVFRAVLAGAAAPAPGAQQRTG